MKTPRDWSEAWQQRAAEASRARAEGMTLAAIGALLGGISRQRVDQLISRAKRVARLAVHDAISSGRLVRPAMCEKCKGGVKPPEAHHPDYSQPLSVVWLCGGCHRQEHLGGSRVVGRRGVQSEAAESVRVSGVAAMATHEAYLKDAARTREAMEAHYQAFGATATAQKFGVSRQRVYRVLEQQRGRSR